MSRRPAPQREYLADRVQTLSDQVSAIGDKVSDVGMQVAEMKGTLTQVLDLAREERDTAREHRRAIHTRIDAQRDEAQDVKMSVTSVQADMGRISKTVAVHEADRLTLIVASKLAKGILPRVGWAVLALAGSAIVFATGWLAKFWQGAPPPPAGH